MGRSLTPELVLRYAQAFGVLQGRGTIVVARDPRPSGVLYRELVAGGLAAVGCRVVDIGITPTPTALGAVLARRARGGVIITASHNPAPWNGLKFAGPEGSFLTAAQMARLSDGARHLQSSMGAWPRRKGEGAPLVPWDRIQPAMADPRAVGEHIARILKAVDAAAIRRRRFTVALDSCNGAGAVAAPALLTALGCRVIGIHVTPSGEFPRGPEPTPKNLAALSRAVRRARAAVGFAQDPDADRLSLVDETGQPLSEELTLALAVQHRLRQCRGPVVVNLSTSRVIDDIAAAAGVRVHRTPVGEVHVVQRMRGVGAVIGGEGNGGVIDPRITWGRDSLAGMALTLEALTGARQPLSALAAPLSGWVLIKRKLALSPAKTATLLASLPRRLPRGRVTLGDGVRIDLPDGWVHLRPSNTEPVVRVFAEAASHAAAQAMLARIKI
ncbi:MAG: phosphoglucosamine mutase [Candidatus Omnitrophica bacterium]|nr:phosphoglucosamine mutase [Candidatus Omnitrophota bacterium]